MDFLRIQFEKAVNRALCSAVEAFRQNYDSWALFQRDLDIQSLMSFFDSLRENK